jgi:hypothetical protein
LRIGVIFSSDPMMKAKPPGGGNVCWFVHRSHDPRLSDQPIGEAMPSLEHYSRASVHEAFKRVAAVERYRQAQIAWARRPERQ